MRSGSISQGFGISRNVGLYGYDWSATTSDMIWGSTGLGAYRFDFDSSRFYSSNGPSDRWIGFPVRCLASGT